MAQPSIASFFATRKRTAHEEANIARAKKVLILDPLESEQGAPCKGVCVGNPVATCDVIYADTKKTTECTAKDAKGVKESDLRFPQRTRLVTKLNFDTAKQPAASMAIKKSEVSKGRPKKARDIVNQPDIQKVLQNLQDKTAKSEAEKMAKELEKTPVKNAMDSVRADKEMSLDDIRNKLSRSSRLAELKASIARFSKSADKLKEIEKKTDTIVPQSPVLHTFKTIELEVQLSPKKQSTPEKLYLSPKNDVQSPRRNLFGLLPSPAKPVQTSPQKVPAYQRFQNLSSPGKQTLTLPYRYRSLAEMFRSIDTVCSIMHNRNETITFDKIKPAVQEMMRKHLTLKHFAQIKALQPDAFVLKYERLRSFGSRTDKYELVVAPGAGEGQMTPARLLERRRALFAALIDRVKQYHHEFLQTLQPPLVLDRERITRWHPEFDLEKVPDVEEAQLPEPPGESRLTTAQDVLDKARELFHCNTRMERALERLRQAAPPSGAGTEGGAAQPTPAAATATTAPPTAASLRGVPAALLEKVRAKQAAKALMAMTRTPDQEQEAVMYGRLPDLARLLRNLFVVEKKGALPLEHVVLKLNHSYRSYLSSGDLDRHLRLLCRLVPGWVSMHPVRDQLFVKVSRNGDLARVMAKLDLLAREKACA